jgi:uncharacterized coiled-coil protein SlyX
MTDVPEVVKEAGYDKEELQKAFSYAQKNLPVLAFTTQPTSEFYKSLHSFICHWDVTRKASKTDIGRFYIAIDPFLRQRGFLPHNAYNYIGRKVSKYEQEKVTALSTVAKPLKVEQSTKTQQKHTESTQPLSATENEELTDLETKCALQDITNKLEDMKAKYENKLKKVYKKIDSLQNDMDVAERNIEKLSTLHQRQEGSESSDHVDKHGNDVYITKNNCQYTPGIRKLYYTLLVNGMPPSKISQNIKTVLQHFLPNMDTDQLVLLKDSCAQYMRREELKTVNDVQKAVQLSL